MNIFVKIADGVVSAGKAVGHFFDNLVKAEKALNSLTPEVKIAAATFFKDLLQAISDVGTAAAGSGINFTADSAAYNDLLKLVNDAKADIDEAKKILEAFGVTV